MDLQEIIDRWKQSTAYMTGGVIATGSSFSSGRVFYNFTNIFVQMPTQMCPGVIEKPDTNINVNISTPVVNSTINSQFTLSYTINAPKNIRRVLVMLNKQQIAVFEYPSGNTKNINDTKQVTITGT